MNGLYLFIGGILLGFSTCVGIGIFMWKDISKAFKDEKPEGSGVMGLDRLRVRELADEAKRNGKTEVSQKEVDREFGKND